MNDSFAIAIARPDELIGATKTRLAVLLKGRCQEKAFGGITRRFTKKENMKTQILSEETGREITVTIEKKRDNPPYWLLIQADGGPQDRFTRKELQQIGANIVAMAKPWDSTVTIS